jgi:hypothetical protein
MAIKSRWMSYVVLSTLLLAGFWYIDIQQTLRLKAGIVKLFSPSIEFEDVQLTSLCSGVHSGNPLAASICFDQLRSTRSKIAYRRSLQCENVRQRLKSGLDKDWASAPSGDVYIYLGNEQEMKGFMFHSKECQFVNLDGRIKVFNGEE